MESMASGALVFIDKMATPRQFPLIHGKHVVYYGSYAFEICYLYFLLILILLDNTNKTAFFEALDFYRADTQLTRRVAVEGYLYSMQHHRAANLNDYVLRVSHSFYILFLCFFKVLCLY